MKNKISRRSSKMSFYFYSISSDFADFIVWRYRGQWTKATLDPATRKQCSEKGSAQQSSFEVRPRQWLCRLFRRIWSLGTDSTNRLVHSSLSRSFNFHIFINCHNNSNTLNLNSHSVQQHVRRNGRFRFQSGKQKSSINLNFRLLLEQNMITLNGLA